MGVPGFYRWITRRYRHIVTRAVPPQEATAKHDPMAMVAGSRGSRAATNTRNNSNRPLEATNFAPTHTTAATQDASTVYIALDHPHQNNNTQQQQQQQNTMTTPLPQQHVTATTIPIPIAMMPNPTGFEIDNLYLDMNGIIHPCAHPDDGRPQPTSEGEMMALVLEYVDRIFDIVRPRRLLFIAIDGVAPRAKMNQQRARRFMAAREADEQVKALATIEEENMQHRTDAHNEAEKKRPWDSNVITPGTPFMARLAHALRHYVRLKMKHCQAWRQLNVIFSDANVPGEGEHKIMAYIRRQRAHPGYNPNIHHCLYGMDADLIMLGIASHEPHFWIFREQLPGKGGTGRVIGGFEFISISAVRDGLMRDLCVEGAAPRNNAATGAPGAARAHTPDGERVLDDFIFLCFFCGNDFLPHLPSVSIHDGALDRLMELYVRVLPALDGYLTENGLLHMGRIAHMLQFIAAEEDETLIRRRKHLQRRRAQQQRSTRVREQKRKQRMAHPKGSMVVGEDASVVDSTQGTSNKRSGSNSVSGPLAVGRKRKRLESGVGDDASSATRTAVTHHEIATATRGKASGEDIDTIELGSPGYQARYFKQKLGIDVNTVDGKAHVDRLLCSYLKGLAWVMLYYYRGVPDWAWYFESHYAPFASGLARMAADSKLLIRFRLGRPFEPFQQLLGVLPARSAHCLPRSYAALMTEPSSAIADFYSTDFETDLNGKTQAWQAVVLLPFIDPERLVSASKIASEKLDAEDRSRNIVGPTLLFVHASRGLAKQIVDKHPERWSLGIDGNAHTPYSFATESLADTFEVPPTDTRLEYVVQQSNDEHHETVVWPRVVDGTVTGGMSSDSRPEIVAPSNSNRDAAAALRASLIAGRKKQKKKRVSKKKSDKSEEVQQTNDSAVGVANVLSDAPVQSSGSAKEIQSSGVTSDDVLLNSSLSRGIFGVCKPYLSGNGGMSPSQDSVCMLGSRFTKYQRVTGGHGCVSAVFCDIKDGLHKSDLLPGVRLQARTQGPPVRRRGGAALSVRCYNHQAHTWIPAAAAMMPNPAMPPVPPPTCPPTHTIQSGYATCASSHMYTYPHHFVHPHAVQPGPMYNNNRQNFHRPPPMQFVQPSAVPVQFAQAPPAAMMRMPARPPPPPPRGFGAYVYPHGFHPPPPNTMHQ